MKNRYLLAVILTASTLASSSQLLANDPFNPSPQPPNLTQDRPLSFDEAQKRGYFERLDPNPAPGYAQRQDALEQRRQMFPPENPAVPTFDSRTQELKNGKPVPKTNAAPAQNGRTNANGPLTRKDTKRNRSCYGSSTRCRTWVPPRTSSCYGSTTNCNRWKPQRKSSCYGNTTRCRYQWKNKQPRYNKSSDGYHTSPIYTPRWNRVDIGKVNRKSNTNPRRQNFQPPAQRSPGIPAELKRVDVNGANPLEINRIGN